MTDFYWLVAGKGVSALTQLVMLLLLASQLEPSRLALLLAVYSAMSVVGALSDMGLGTLALRERADHKYESALEILRIAERLAAIAGVISFVTLLVLSHLTPVLAFSLPLVIWATIERVSENRFLQLAASGQAIFVAFVNASRRILALFVFTALWLILPLELAFSLSLSAAALIGQVVTARMYRLPKRGRFVGVNQYLRRSAPFTVTALSSQMRNLDVPTVAILVGGTSAAAYGLGARMANPALLVYSAISGLLLVRVRELTVIRTRLLISAIVLLPVALTALLLLLSPSIFQVLAGFLSWISPESTMLMVIVASTYLFAGSAILLGAMCASFNRETKQARVNLLTAVGSLIIIAACAVITGSALTGALGGLVSYFAQVLVLALIAHRAAPEVLESS